MSENECDELDRARRAEGALGAERGQVKPTYQAPFVLPLGQVKRGVGADCFTGSLATDNCQSGLVPSGACSSGTTASNCIVGPVVY